MQLRDYQLPAVDFLAARRRAFVIAPAGSGKTVIGAAALQKLCCTPRRVRKVTWLANTIEQVDQAVASLKIFPCDGDVEIQVECVAAQPDTSDSDVIVMDEAHHAPARTWEPLVRNTPRTCCVWGLSATPWHDKDTERNKCVVALFESFYEIERYDIQDSGHLAEGRIVMWDLDEPGEFDEEIKDLAWPEIEKQMRRFKSWDPIAKEEMLQTVTQRVTWRFTQPFVFENPKRQAKIQALCSSEVKAGHSVLLLVATKTHGRELSRLTGGTFCHSGMGAKKRSTAIEGARSGDIKCLIATSLADEGLDIPRLSRLILACGGRSSTKLTQRVGRVLRPFDGKEFGLCHDFLDRGAALANAQAWARVRKYRELGYAIEGLNE